MGFFDAAIVRRNLAQDVAAAGADTITLVGRSVLQVNSTGATYVIREGSTDADIVIRPTHKVDGSWRTVKNFGYGAPADADAIVARLLEVSA